MSLTRHQSIAVQKDKEGVTDGKVFFMQGDSGVYTLTIKLLDGDNKPFPIPPDTEFTLLY